MAKLYHQARSRTNNTQYMRPNYLNENPNSFVETVELVKNYVVDEIRRETKTKQLYYHTVDHSFAVQRRAKHIFQELEFVLSQSRSSQELERLKILTDLCGLAHDMVQLFNLHSTVGKPRRHISGQSEIETANKLLQYIQDLNQQLATCPQSNSILFNDRDREIIKDAILATICQVDPQAGKAKYSFFNFFYLSTLSLQSPAQNFGCRQHCCSGRFRNFGNGRGGKLYSRWYFNFSGR